MLLLFAILVAIDDEEEEEDKGVNGGEILGFAPLAGDDEEVEYAELEGKEE